MILTSVFPETDVRRDAVARALREVLDS